MTVFYFLHGTSPTLRFSSLVVNLFTVCSYGKPTLLRTPDQGPCLSHSPQYSQHTEQCLACRTVPGIQVIIGMNKQGSWSQSIGSAWTALPSQNSSTVISA